MWEKIAAKIFEIVAQELTALSAVFMVLFVWGEYKAWQTRKRMAVVLDAKDTYSAGVVERTFTMGATMTQLVEMLETLVRRSEK